MKVSRRVRAATVDLVRGSDGLVVAADPGPTRERLAHGDVRVVRLIDDFGQRVAIRRALSLPERLAQLGELGDNAVKLLAAAEWFEEQSETARLRGRMVKSQLARALADETIDRDAVLQARIRLARAYDALGTDAFNEVYSCIVWMIEPIGPRRALLRSGLHALAHWLERRRYAVAP
jgi:hypothetical protein